MRPNFITPLQIENWTRQIDEDPLFPKDEANTLDPKLKEELFEACFSGFYLAEELTKLSCPVDLILRIQFTAGKMSFGRDPWEEHLKVLEAFKNGELLIEDQNEGEMN